jgi:mannose-6-phosphate isomerase-like protein (cupin superfamily)
VSSTHRAFPGISHYHDTQDELYFVHSGTAKIEVDGEERILGPGGLFHAESTTTRRIANGGDDELVLLVIGGKDGYVERDGHVTSDETWS